MESRLSRLFEAVDAVTGEPLADAFAVRAERAASRETPLFGPDPSHRGGKTLRTDMGGRIGLPDEPNGWWIVAPDHAWRHVEVAPGSEPVRVELARNGGVRVIVENWETLTDASVVARPRDTRGADALVELLAEAPPGVFGIAGLPPGPWTVIVGRRGLNRLERAWDEANVTIPAGGTAEVRMSPTQPPDDRRDIDVEFVVPAAWRSQPIGQRSFYVWCLGCEPRTASTESWTVPLDSDPTRVRWRRAQEGLYFVRVEPLGWTTLVRVPSTGPLRIAIPPPVFLRVRVTTPNGAPLVGAEVRVSYANPGVDDDISSASIGLEQLAAIRTLLERVSSVSLPSVSESGEARGTVVAGRVVVRARTRCHVPARLPVILTPGQEREIVLCPTPGGSVEASIVRQGRAVAQRGRLTLSSSPHALEDDWDTMTLRREPPYLLDELPAGEFTASWRPDGSTDSISTPIVVRIGETTRVELEWSPK